MKEYLRSDYRQFEDSPFIRDRIVEAFDAVGKHVAKLEARINALEKGGVSNSRRGRER